MVVSTIIYNMERALRDENDITSLIGWDEDNPTITETYAEGVKNIRTDGNGRIIPYPEGYQLQFEGDGSTIYLGYSMPGAATSAASWQIQKIAVTSTTVAITWADGDKSFDNVWDNRASLSFS